jgi:hypothetical protein
MPLPVLMPGEGKAQVSVSRRSVGKPPEEYGPIRCLYAEDGEVHLSWGNVAELLVCNGSEIIVDPASNTHIQLLRNFILGPALGILLYQRGRLVLHASAVVIDGRAIAFLGWKGSGKSTIAAALHARGHKVAADDLVALKMDGVKKPMVLPGIPQLKLWPDAVKSIGENPESFPRLYIESEKRARRIDDGFSDISIPLEKIYVLDPGGKFEGESVKFRDAFIELTRHSYAQRFMASNACDRAHFAKCMRLAQSIPIYRLTRETSRSAAEIAEWIETESNEQKPLQIAPAKLFFGGNPE